MEMKPKQQVRRVLDKLPEDATIDEIIATVQIGHKVRQGLAEVERGAIVSLEDAETRLNRWIEG
jgi:predicted transcriptional regulator